MNEVIVKRQYNYSEIGAESSCHTTDTIGMFNVNVYANNAGDGVRIIITTSLCLV